MREGVVMGGGVLSPSQSQLRYAFNKFGTPISFDGWRWMANNPDDPRTKAAMNKGRGKVNVGEREGG